MSDHAQDGAAPAEQLKASRTPTISSGTHVSVHDQTASGGDGIEKAKADNVLHGGEGESAFPEDKKVRSHLGV